MRGRFDILLFEFNRGAKAAEVARNICAMYRDNAIGESMVRKWFSRFKEDRFDSSDTPRFEHSNPRHNDLPQCTQELANLMYCDHSTIVRHLHSMGRVKKSGVLHALSQIHKGQQVAICASLLACHRLAHEQHRPFQSCIVTGDKKWCLYANIRKIRKTLKGRKQTNKYGRGTERHLPKTDESVVRPTGERR